MQKRCRSGGHHWFGHLSDGRFKCRRCSLRQSFVSVWDSCRLSEAAKRKRLECFRKRLECFVWGVPASRLRFRGPASPASPASLEATERFFRLVRQRIALPEECAEAFEGCVACDETMFGGSRAGKHGSRAGKHGSRAGKHGWGAAGKVIVFGIYKRNGLVRVLAVNSRPRAEWRPLIETPTAKGCLYYTDNWHADATLGVRGDPVVVSKDKGLPKGRDHIKGIEGFWSYAKNWWYPYRGVPKKFFHRSFILT